MSQLFHLGERMDDHASLKADLAELTSQLRDEKDNVLAKEKEIKTLKLKVRNQDEAGSLAAAENISPRERLEQREEEGANEGVAQSLEQYKMVKTSEAEDRSSERASKNIGIDRGTKNSPEMPKLDERTEKLEVARSMRSGRGGNHLAWYVAREALGVAVKMITACGVTHRSTRWISQARGVAMHATGPCGQTCGGRGVSFHGARPCIQTGRGRGVILHETETCSQPCGARGVAPHASGAMRSDTRAATRAATRLVPDLLLVPLLGSWIMADGRLANAECLDDIAKFWIVSVPSDLVPGVFKETPYSLDREDSDERGHVLWLSITRRCNMAVTRRTVGCRAVTRRTVDCGRLKVPSSGLCGEPFALDCLGWDSERLYLLVGDCNSLSNARLLTPHSLLFHVTSSELVKVAGG
ncbi:hypothetical protein DY000_02007631 [Brassica cretica]|uniref:Uncharacterized protein n=1 Tax=Brassica cretica TaxID=69181 RepID=A0ABQ7CM96_BRACR|nr:hypothetical protein DY000_02007631 [Brassica cretica]